EQGLNAIGLQDADLGQVFLVGGGAQLFSVYQSLEKRFADKDLVLADNPDESVVVGVSLEYGASSSKSRPSLLFMPDFELLTKEPTTSEAVGFRLESPADISFGLKSGENGVGRAPTNEIHIVGEKISRFHARLVVTDGKVEILDLGSTNGTFVNDARLEKDQAVTLEAGDEIRFGDMVFHLKDTA
ncbi:MAG: FHA domain-containing protein, partial [Candidatus Deferrimicrobiaceae bacterium]